MGGWERKNLRGRTFLTTQRRPTKSLQEKNFFHGQGRVQVSTAISQGESGASFL